MPGGRERQHPCESNDRASFFGKRGHRQKDADLNRHQHEPVLLKGDLTFESLRQACIEPAERVYIGAEPPRGALEGHTISALSVTDAPWISSGTVELNSRLIAVIGARGSGTTALAGACGHLSGNHDLPAGSHGAHSHYAKGRATERSVAGWALGDSEYPDNSLEVLRTSRQH